MVTTPSYYQAHKEEIKAKSRAYHLEHREEINAKRRETARSNPEINTSKCREYRNSHIEERRAAERAYGESHRDQKHVYDKNYRAVNGDAMRKQQAARRAYLWERALEFFGPCACCGESTIPFLTIDHINGSGNKRRAAGEKFGYGLISSWETAGWPIEIKKEFRILCHNCNQATRYGRPCPHQIERERGHNG